MEQNYNKLNQVPIANVDANDLKQIQQLEQQMGDKYVLIAFQK